MQEEEGLLPGCPKKETFLPGKAPCRPTRPQGHIHGSVVPWCLASPGFSPALHLPPTACIWPILVTCCCYMNTESMNTEPLLVGVKFLRASDYNIFVN